MDDDGKKRLKVITDKYLYHMNAIDNEIFAAYRKTDREQILVFAALMDEFIEKHMKALLEFRDLYVGTFKGISQN